MAITVLFIDLRNEESKYENYDVEYLYGMTAGEALRTALGEDRQATVEHDLLINNREVIVAWIDLNTKQRSEVGGVADLEWDIPDPSILIVIYEDERTTSKQIDESGLWMSRFYGNNSADFLN